jgi:hypothetical protein
MDWKSYFLYKYKFYCSENNMMQAQGNKTADGKEKSKVFNHFHGMSEVQGNIHDSGNIAGQE